MKISDLYLYCPYCGHNFKMESVLVGYGKKEKCKNCGREITVRKKFCRIKNISLWLPLVIFYIPLDTLSDYLYINVIGADPYPSGQAAFFVNMYLVLSLPYVFLWCIIFHPRIPWIENNDKEKEKKGENEEQG